MLIDEIVDFCNTKYRNSKCNRCHNCSYGDNCPGSCDRCLHYIHTPTVAPAPREYDCSNMACYYTCKYSYRYMSELINAFLFLRDLKRKSNIKVMSVGCGPCTDLFALDYLKTECVYKFESVEFRGIDPAKEVWLDIHKQIKKYNPSIIIPEFYYEDVTEFIDVITKSKWIPDLIVFQYVFSDMEKHCDSIRLHEFISKLALFVNDAMSANTYIVLNDINLTTQMGGGRELFDELLDQINNADSRRFHFKNNNKLHHYNYGDEYEDNSLIVANPQFIDDYNPYDSCASAQLIIKKVK